MIETRKGEKKKQKCSCAVRRARKSNQDAETSVGGGFGGGP